ncbi:hypothetical protein EX30DRAFT_46728 [Ascodesmis nigricans]|uniref:Uncharacterized protein n=1 Tax=Ascodesmis nigricans TaxID=341454 RepID=A0A4S2MVV5_9PEZI|nr:hypothetical protein EX30DRAFT_46728 [Ascodesmis nigricans]
MTMGQRRHMVPPRQTTEHLGSDILLGRGKRALGREAERARSAGQGLAGRKVRTAHSGGVGSCGGSRGSGRRSWGGGEFGVGGVGGVERKREMDVMDERQ